MGIFNNDRIEELERKLRIAECERDEYMKQTYSLTRKLEAVTKLEEVIPEDCVKGPWCKACEFVKVFHYEVYRGYGEPVYACSKGKSCNNFVQKKY